MPIPPERSSRHSLRLPEHDYSHPGAYFVTLVAYRRESLFGEIRNGEMVCNDAGKIVREVWGSLAGRYPNLTLDEAVVMPNHFHGIVVIEETPVAVIHELPLRGNELPPREEGSNRIARRRMLLPMVIGYFKMNSAKRINLLLASPGVPVWQRNYYERIIRDERAFARIRAYIRSNPANWDGDKENR